MKGRSKIDGSNEHNGKHLEHIKKQEDLIRKKVLPYNQLQTAETFERYGVFKIKKNETDEWVIGRLRSRQNTRIKTNNKIWKVQMQPKPKLFRTHWIIKLSVVRNLTDLYKYNSILKEVV